MRSRFTLNMSVGKVFVYGTLKKGQPNHVLIEKPLLKGNALFIANAKTCQKFPLVIGTRFNIPFLLQVPGKGEFVHGEVYEVDQETLKSLDRLEGHPNYYIREEVTVKYLDESDFMGPVWCYFLPQGRFPEHILNYPTLSNYDSMGSHGKQYVRATEKDKNVTDPDMLITWNRQTVE